MALHRTFNGKRYYFDSQYHNEVRARSRAEQIRREGGLARVIKIDPLTWGVWVRNA